MAEKWDWLKEEMGGFSALTKLPLLMKFIKGRVSGPDDLTKCALCPNMCRHACPVGIVDGKETTSPAGKSRIGMFIKEGGLEMNKENIRPLYMCLSCGCCEDWCPFDFSVSDLLLPLKEEFIDKGDIFPEFKSILDDLEIYGYVYGEPPEDELDLSGRDLLYLRGCSTRENHPETVENTLKIFKRLRDDPMVIDDEICCGIPAYNIGDIGSFKKIAKENADKINSSGRHLLVTSCPSCAYTYKVLYPEIGCELDAEVLHITEYLEKKMPGKIRSKKELEITYHDPCKLVHGLGKPDMIKKLLNGIEGVDVIDPRRSSVETFCCGYGGSAVSRLEPDLADDISKERLSELSDRAKIIITACPTCKESFLNNVPEDADIEIMDISDLLQEIG